MEDRLMRLKMVLSKVPISRSTLYLWMKDGKFPRPVDLGGRIAAWKESDINKWLNDKMGVKDGE
jgi:prophage regulatory protein